MCRAHRLSIAFGLLSANGELTLFGDEVKFADVVLPETVTLAPWDAFPRCLTDLTDTVLIEPASLPQAAFDALSAGHAQDFARSGSL